MGRILLLKWGRECERQKKPVIVIIIIAVVAIAVTILSVKEMTNPLNKSVEKIEKDLLKLMPLGTSLEDVIRVIENNEKWKVWYKSKWIQSWASNDEDFINYTIDCKSIMLVLGKVKVVMVVDVDLKFEGDGLDMKLTKIEVRKYMSI